MAPLESLAFGICTSGVKATRPLRKKREKATVSQSPMIFSSATSHNVILNVVGVIGTKSTMCLQHEYRDRRSVTLQYLQYLAKLRLGIGPLSIENH